MSHKAVLMKKAERAALKLPKQALKVHVHNRMTCELAGRLLNKVKAAQRYIMMIFEPMKQKARAAHLEICNQETKLLRPLKDAEKKLKDGIGTYAAREEKIVEAKRIKAQEKAEKKAKEEQEREAKRAEKAGDRTSAKAIRTAPVVVAPVEVTHNRPEMNEISIRDEWSYEIVDAAKIPREFLMPDRKRIQKEVDTWKDETKVPGVRVFNKKGVAAGTGEAGI